jgi:integrase
MARKKKRRVRSPHSGVKIKKRVLPSGTTYRAVYVDPDKGKEIYLKLDPQALPTAESRTAWAKAKAKSLAKRRMELESGAPRATGTALSKAIDQYFDAVDAGAIELRPRTRAIYKHAADKFEAWCARHSVESADEITRPRLVEFRETITAEKKRAPKKKSARGTREETSRRRSPAAVNQELRALRTVLRYLLDQKQLLPKVSSADLRVGLQLRKVTSKLPGYLDQDACQRLLEAAMRHDSATHLVTREEHQGLRAIGSTERYPAIAPFTAFCLLTGCRVGEALALRWRDVALDKANSKKEKIGEIKLQGTATKTKEPRVVSFDVCPSLRTMLAAMKLRAGGAAYVFGGDEPLSRDQVEAARKRLIGNVRHGSRGRKRKKGPAREIQVSGFGAPEFSWQLLRSTCATVGSSAPSIWGTAAAFASAKRLGQSVAIADKRYAALLFEVREDAKTLEAAMEIETQMAEIVARAGSLFAAKQAAI